MIDKKNLPVGKYWYTRPDWNSDVKVSVEIYGNKKVVRFSGELYPTDMDDIPYDAIFTTREE